MNTRLVLRVAITALLSVCFLQAQEVKELSKHPGDILKFEIRFDGPDAAKVKIVRILLARQTDPPPNQVGFNTTPQGGDFYPSATGVFQTEIKIPSGVPSGDYSLQVTATSENGTGSATYDAGKDFQLHRFHIDNPATFAPPQIKVTEKP
jgi:hypothetical protein